MGAEPYNLAAILADDLLTAWAGRLGELKFSAEESRALRRVWEVALNDLLELGQFRPQHGGVSSEDVLREFVSTAGTADALLDLVIEERPPRLELLGQRFETVIGYTASSPVNFEDALAALLRCLVKALVTETREPGAPPDKHVSILRPAAIHNLLKERTGTLEEITAAVVRLEEQVPQQAKYNVFFLGQSAGTVIGDDARVRQEFSVGPLLEQTLTEIKTLGAAGPSLKMGIDTLTELLGGISGISADYAGRIKNFLIEYLGTPDRVVPFGGRQEEMTYLDHWLTNPAAPPYCLITAEAGRGKSALLARWADSLIRRVAAHVVFIPVSIRFNTAAAEVTFTALAARLSEVYGEPVKWASLTSQQWREICLKYLSRRPPGDTPLLIILDGLDEASDWRAGPDLLPLAPPPGIRIAVSARYLAGDVDERGWLARLCWGPDIVRNLPLPTLTRAGVSEVLAAMGNPLDRLATQVDVIGELFRLSEGDPLLVRLYVEALLPYGNRAAAIRPEDLPSIQEGLAGYFERWWEDQRSQWEAQRRNELMEKEDILKFLNVCACALGPLTHEDIAAVVGGTLTFGLRIRSVARDVARFVIGDGERGYVFGHPRLGYFFRDQMTEQERTGWEERFLNYGRDTLESLNTSRLPPDKAPAYALRCYGAHLERAKAQPESLWELVSEGWLRGWYTLEGSYAGFLNDAARAWRAAENVRPERGDRGVLCDAMAVQFRSALCHASVAALSIGIPTLLLGLAKEHGVLTPLQALVLARQIPNEMACANALVTITPGLPEWMQEDVLAAIQRFESEGGCAWTLGQLAPHLSDGLRKLAVEHARSFLNLRARALALCELGSHLAAEAGELVMREAYAAVKEIKDVRVQSRALSGLAARLRPASPLVSELLEIARAVEDHPSRARALTSLIPHLASPLREEILASAHHAAHNSIDPYSRALLLARLAPLLDESERSEVMSLILRDIRSFAIAGERVTGLLALIAPHLPQAHLDSAVEWASGQTWTKKSSGPVVSNEDHISSILAKLEPIRERLGVSISEIRYLLERVGLNKSNAGLGMEVVTDALSNIMGYEAASRLAHEQVRELRRAALDYYNVVMAARERTARTTPLPSGLTLLLPHLSQPLRDEVCANILSVTGDWEPDTQSKMLAAVAAYLPLHLMDSALEKLKLLEPSYEQVRALALLLPRLTEGERKVLTPRLVEAAAGLADEDARVKALTQLASLPPEMLNGTRRKEILRKALEAAQAIHDKLEAVRFRANMAKALTGEWQARSMGSALEQIFQIQDGEALVNLLQDFLPSVPESLAGRALEMLLAHGGVLDDATQVKFVLNLLPRLQETHKGRAVHELLGRVQANFQPPLGRVWLAGELFVYLSPEQARATLEDARAGWTHVEYLSLVVKVFRHLTSEKREEVWHDLLARAGEFLLIPQGSNLLVQALNSQPEEIQGALAERLWMAVGATSFEENWWVGTHFSLRLLRHLSEGRRAQLVRDLIANLDSLTPTQLVEVCRSTARFIPADLLPETFAKVAAIRDNESRAWALVSLVPRLEPELRGQALSAIRRAISGLPYRLDMVNKILSRIASYITVDERSGFVSEVLAMGFQRGWGFEVEALRAVIPLLAEDSFADALRHVRSLTHPRSKVEAYALLCSRFPQGLRDEALEEAWAIVSGLAGHQLYLPDALALLGPVLPDEAWKTKAMKEALEIADGPTRVSALTALAPFLPEGLKVQAMSWALEAVNGIEGRAPRALILMSLAVHIPLTGRLMQDAVHAVLSLRYNERLSALRALAPRLAAWAVAQPEPAYELWNECLHLFSQHPRPAFFNEADALLPFTLALTPEEEKEDVILSMLRAGHDVAKWWP